MSAEKFSEARLYAEAIELSWAHRDQINSLLTKITDPEMRERAQRGYVVAVETGIAQGLANFDQTRLLMEGLAEGLFPDADGEPQMFAPRRSVA